MEYQLKITKNGGEIQLVSVMEAVKPIPNFEPYLDKDLTDQTLNEFFSILDEECFRVISEIERETGEPVTLTMGEGNPYFFENLDPLKKLEANYLASLRLKRLFSQVEFLKDTTYIWTFPCWEILPEYTVTLLKID